MPTITEEIAGIAIAEILGQGDVSIPPDRYEDAQDYAQRALTVMDNSYPDIDPETDEPLDMSKAAAVTFVKLKLMGRPAGSESAFLDASDRYAKQAIRIIRKTKADNDNLVDEDARLDMFET